MVKNLLLWMIIAAVLLMVFQNFSQPATTQQVNYSDFIREVQNGQVAEVTISGLNIVGRKSSGQVFNTIRPYIEDPKLMDDLLANNVSVKGAEPEQ
ncbi:MAG TPA: ATP-dependent metalloprotease, partial [Pseudomonadaceae bacterium]|nr:ATP-dependent metalloprotease [Pseudomonadaceae bacterium]